MFDYFFTYLDQPFPYQIVVKLPENIENVQKKHWGCCSQLYAKKLLIGALIAIDTVGEGNCKKSVILSTGRTHTREEMSVGLPTLSASTPAAVIRKSRGKVHLRH